MAVDRMKHGAQDRSQISLDQEREIRYRTQELGVSEAALTPPRFMFSRKIRGPATFDFCNTIPSTPDVFRRRSERSKRADFVAKLF
jgi:hypothetical protein